MGGANMKRMWLSALILAVGCAAQGPTVAETATPGDPAWSLSLVALTSEGSSTSGDLWLLLRNESETHSALICLHSWILHSGAEMSIRPIPQADCGDSADFALVPPRGTSSSYLQLRESWSELESSVSGFGLTFTEKRVGVRGPGEVKSVSWTGNLTEAQSAGERIRALDRSPNK
jgi:hypothetical protein